MCGRFVQNFTLETIKKLFNISDTPSDISSNFNVAPTHEILAILKHDNENKLERLYWGLVPFWAKDISIGSRMINARAETVSKKASFRNAIKKRRCFNPLPPLAKPYLRHYRASGIFSDICSSSNYYRQC